jgi:hypothetical protein
MCTVLRDRAMPMMISQPVRIRFGSVIRSSGASGFEAGQAEHPVLGPTGVVLPSMVPDYADIEFVKATSGKPGPNAQMIDPCAGKVIQLSVDGI